MSATQYVVLGFFILCAIAGVIVFATMGGSSGGGSQTLAVTMWGTIPSTYIEKAEEVLNSTKPGTIAVTYTQKDPSTFDTDLTEALAEGKGPDIVLLPSPFLLHDQNKLALIPWSYVSESTFKNTFAEAGEVFLTDKGSYAIPFIIDPLVMYWNRDTFNAASISLPPATWDQVTAEAPKFSVLAPDKTVLKSAVPFGEYANVSNAKNILAALTLEAGGRMVARNGADATNYLLEIPQNSTVPAFESAVSFYTQFADPSQTTYSWNRSLPNSQDDFLSGNLAMYFGMASEIGSIRDKNPNLNFDVTSLPQVKGVPTKTTYADVYGFAVLANSKNQQNAANAIILLASQPVIKAVSDLSGLPPVRRDLLATLPGTDSGDVFYNSALWSKAWLDPSPTFSAGVFKTMIESITSGQARVQEATRIAGQQFDESLRSQ